MALAIEKNSKGKVAAVAKQLVAGAQKHLKGTTQVTLLGTSLTPEQIASKLQSIADLRAEVDASKATTQAKVANEIAQMPALRALMSAFESYVRASFGSSPDVLADFGMAVFAAARKIAGSAADAKDLTQQAFLRLDTTSPWSLALRVGLEQHLYGILRSLHSHEMAARARRNAYEQRGGEEHAAQSEAGRSAEVIYIGDLQRRREEALATRRVAALRARLAGQELDLRILDLMAEGFTKRSDLALRTGRSADEVKTTLARIRRHMNAILAAERGEDEGCTNDEANEK